MSAQYGHAEGDRCNRSGCQGVIGEHPVENCSCHIAPPCGACTAARSFCAECGWEASEEQVFNDYKVSMRPDGTFRSWEPRPLDPSKLDWHSKPHSNSSMVKEGVYPEWMTREVVEEKVRGTFGGRFESFGDGKFKYIAYTD